MFHKQEPIKRPWTDAIQTDIDTMEAGPKLRLLIAEWVMGWTNCRMFYKGTRHEYIAGVDPDGITKRVPLWDIDIAAAWQVVESDIWPRADWGIVRLDSVEQIIEIWDLARWELETGLIARGPAPLAICRAALKAAAKEV